MENQPANNSTTEPGPLDYDLEGRPYRTTTKWDDDPPVVRRLREALQQALPGLRDLVNQQCPDPDVAERDKRVLALALEVLEIT